MLALPLKSTWNLSPLAAGTATWNVIDSTAGVVPVTFVDPELDQVTEQWINSGIKDSAKVLEMNLYGKDYKGGHYDPKSAMKGLPVGVQIVGGLWEEEKVRSCLSVLSPQS